VEAAAILVDELGDLRRGSHQPLVGVVARSQQVVSDFVRQRAAHHAAEDAVAGERRPFVNTRSEQHRRLNHPRDRVRVEDDRRGRRPIDEVDRTERVRVHVAGGAVGDRDRQLDGAVAAGRVGARRFLNLDVVSRPDRGRLFHHRGLELRPDPFAGEHEIDLDVRRRRRGPQHRQQKGECNRRHMASLP